VLVRGQRFYKKKQISSGEYIDLEAYAIKNVMPLKSIRLTTIDSGLYMIMDWYYTVETQPLTCIIQVNKNRLEQTGERIMPPSYLSIEKEITDMPDFRTFELAQRVNPALAKEFAHGKVEEQGDE